MMGGFNNPPTASQVLRRLKGLRAFLVKTTAAATTTEKARGTSTFRTGGLQLKMTRLDGEQRNQSNKYHVRTSENAPGSQPPLHW